MESENRMEYGYGSGYINGQIKKEKLCFSEDPKSPCIEKVKILEAD